MTPAWTASQKTRLSLQQLGVSTAQIESAEEYYHYSTDQPSDQDFLLHVGRFMAFDPTSITHINRMAALTEHWQPHDSVWTALINHGYTATALQAYRDQFVAWAVEEGTTVAYPEQAFIKYCLQQTTTLPHPMPEGWLPSPCILQEISERITDNEQYVNSRIAPFKRQYQSLQHHDWDRKFLVWVNQGWNIRGHSFNYKICP